MEALSSCSKICFWDKHEITGEVIKCPVMFKPKQIVRKKKEYYINQNYPRSYEKKILDDSQSSFLDVNILEHKIFYDDSFCSYSCCLAWIEDNSNDPKYQNSKKILYNELIHKKIKIPQVANHWRILKNFGGFLDIEKFRDCKNRYGIIDNFYDENGDMKYLFKEQNYIE